MRIGRDAYWAAVAKAEKALDRGGDVLDEAKKIAFTFDPLDVARWTYGWPGVRDLGPKTAWHDLRRSLELMLVGAVIEDIDWMERMRQIPDRAPRPSHELTKDEYWAAVQEIADYTARHLAAGTRPSGAVLPSARPERMLEYYAERHPFADFPRSLDVIRQTQSLDDLEASVAEDTDMTPLEAYQSAGYEGFFTLVAQRLMLEDAKKIFGAHGLGYVPNLRPDDYFNVVKRLSRSVGYPPNWGRDMQTARAMVPDFYDCLDALRMAEDPGFIGAYLISAAVTGGVWVAGNITPPSLYVDLPDRGAVPIDVPGLMQAAAWLCLVDDADTWDQMRAFSWRQGPPRMTLDEYVDYVDQAARTVARARDPADALLSMFDVSGMGRPHPLLHLDPAGGFPYRTLDVLYHSRYPNALLDQAWRRQMFELASNHADALLDAAFSKGAELTFVAAAAAALLSDVLDALGSIHLGKYAPNEVG